MSFILDALKKSEGDRQRQAGPALFEVRVAPPRSRFPLWSVVLAILLGVNALVLAGWLMVRATRSGDATVETAGGAAVPSPPAHATPATQTAAVGATRMPSAPRDPELAALDGAAPTATATPDEEPAVEPPPADHGSSAAVRTESAGLPTRDELHSAAVAALPELRLDLLVYDADPAKRFVMINMHRLREGDSLPEGVRVGRITEEGAELEYSGTRFLLPHE